MSKKIKTEHPYIVKVDEICNGKAVINGTRITVRQIAWLFKAGDTPDEILQSYPHLKPAQIYDAISYYFDHQDEIESEIKANRIEKVLEENQAVIDKNGIVHFTKNQYG